MNWTKFIILIISAVGLVACGNNAEVVEANSKDASPSTGIFSTNPAVKKDVSSSSDNTVHEVTVLDILPTEKYIYLEVEENNEKFWVATRKQDVKKGERYFFKGGLLKTNFESKEYNRVFDKVFLVSNLVSMKHGHGHGHGHEHASNTASDEKSIVKSIKINNPKEGSIKIAEIVDNPEKYKGKTVQVTGQCTKLNPNIMGRNWIHLKDGSKDDYDFVLTSNTAVPEGHVVTLSGIVVLDKDFGAGYRYELIIEQAEIVN